ncbi:MAG TPA: hypothetical protein VFQ85_02795 [Mycobacteriales bacterium]|nr:hypothetical protein [Mycobacteriales bacterium]
MNKTLAATARAQAGAFSERQALRSGLTRAAVRRRVAAGLWHEPFPHVYWVAGLPPSTATWTWAAALATGPPYALTGRAALHRYGLLADAPPPVDVVVPVTRRGRRPAPELALHRTTRWAEPVPVGDLFVAAVPDALAFAAPALGRAATLAVVQDAVFRGLAHVTDLAARRGRGRSGAAVLGAVLAEYAAGHDCVAEVRAAEALAAAGFAPRGGVVLHGRGVSVGPVDLYLDGGLVVELDGWDAHTTRRSFARDRARHNALTRLGVESLRYVSGDVTRDPGRLVADVRAWYATRPRPPRTDLTVTAPNRAARRTVHPYAAQH